jgi:hypothetical protein
VQGDVHPAGRQLLRFFQGGCAGSFDRACWWCPQARVAAAVSLLTPAEQVGSYATLLRIQPFLRRETLAEALSWRR